MPTRVPSAKIKPAAEKQKKIPEYEPNIPEPKHRADLLKHWIELLLDERTANKVLWITEGGAKVSRTTDDSTCPVLDRPERYEHAPQVMCKDGVAGFRGYFEVECSGWVLVGAAYPGAGRRAADGLCGLGENDESWGFGWGGSFYQAWFDSGDSKEIRDVQNFPRLGIYIDHPLGIINFYGVKDVEGGDDSTVMKEVQLLHQMRRSFKDKLMPAFWLGTNSSCKIVKEGQ